MRFTLEVTGIRFLGQDVAIVETACGVELICGVLYIRKRNFLPFLPVWFFLRHEFNSYEDDTARTA